MRLAADTAARPRPLVGVVSQLFDAQAQVAGILTVVDQPGVVKVAVVALEPVHQSERRKNLADALRRGYRKRLK